MFRSSEPDVDEHASETDGILSSQSPPYQMSVARVVGALAHELSNPLQGVLSLLSLYARECGESDSTHSRIEQIQAAVGRMTRIIENFSVVYENLPRAADRTTADILGERLAAEFSERGWEPMVRPIVE